MENKELIDSRIEDLKWRALPLFDKLMIKKHQLRNKKFFSRARRKELRATIRNSNLTILIIAGCFLFGHLSVDNMSGELSWLFISSLIMLVVLRIELSFRLMCLKEVKFLKEIKQKISMNFYFSEQQEIA